jgi:hypothetical protein
MREHGIELEAVRGGNIHPVGNPSPNPESPSFQRAQTACQKLSIEPPTR